MKTSDTHHTDDLTRCPPIMEIKGVITTLDCARNEHRTDDDVSDSPTVSKPCAKTFQAPAYVCTSMYVTKPRNELIEVYEKTLYQGIQSKTRLRELSCTSRKSTRTTNVLFFPRPVSYLLTCAIELAPTEECGLPIITTYQRYSYIHNMHTTNRTYQAKTLPLIVLLCPVYVLWR
jgi:hypothetical protein